LLIGHGAWGAKEKPVKWHKITLNPQEAGMRHMEDVELKFDALFMAAGCPPEMALFAARGGKGLDLYFTPDASIMANELIQAYEGSDCEQPRADQVELVEGFRTAARLCA
jgi:hypothetical protein